MLAADSHTFQVRAVDESGNRQGPSTFFSWNIVVTIPPPDSTCIGSGSGNRIITGTPGPDTFIGTSGNNIINGLAGNDAINGCSRNDMINGGDEDDGIAGSSGNDILHGDNGDDMVDGGSGNDQIFGYSGVNTLTGGAGRDVFICGPNGDTITDFKPGEDTRSGNCILGPALAPAAVAAPNPPATPNANSNPTVPLLLSLPFP
jgi:Ca2+-binding RTX toxin-like protein